MYYPPLSKVDFISAQQYQAIGYKYRRGDAIESKYVCTNGKCKCESMLDVLSSSLVAFDPSLHQRNRPSLQFSPP